VARGQETEALPKTDAIEETLAEAAAWDGELSPEEWENFARSFTCYVL
jgi:hypothetical protein